MGGRNFEVQADPQVMEKFVSANNLVQVTAASVSGDFGERPQKCARALLVSRLAHFVASDAHSADRRPPGLSSARAVVETLLPTDEVEEMFARRPRKLLAGEYFDLPEPTKTNCSRSRFSKIAFPKIAFPGRKLKFE